MIFVTVGVTEPFPRLVEKVDEIATSTDEDFVVQYGKTNCDLSVKCSFAMCSPQEHAKYIEQADLVVTHAGTGTVLQCVQTKTRLVLVPRRSKYGEHINDHQLTQAKTWKSVLDAPIVDDVSNLKKNIRGPHEDLPIYNGDKNRQLEEEIQSEIDSV